MAGILVAGSAWRVVGIILFLIAALILLPVLLEVALFLVIGHVHHSLCHRSILF